MSEISQVGAMASVEPRTTPVGSAGESRPQRAGGETSSSQPAEAAPAGRSDAAYSVELSSPARQAAPEQPEPRPESTSGLSQGGESGIPNSGTPTNQVTSFESERTGNNPRHTSEASRTLGQVIDTFA